MCRVLEVSVSSYYAWIQRPESHRAQENRQLREAIQRIHEEKYQTYGSPRMTAELQKKG
ncbi:IS3 family transposase, partial [Prosthecochloris ethylica]|nr:transposase [Prosthecochloris ethylica]